MQHIIVNIRHGKISEDDADYGLFILFLLTVVAMVNAEYLEMIYLGLGDVAELVECLHGFDP